MEDSCFKMEQLLRNETQKFRRAEDRISGRIRMDKGYIENGFIVDLSNAKKTSEIIYELSRILDLPEAKDKNVCLKLGEVDLNQSQLISVKALIESMDSNLAFISSVNAETKNSAQTLGIALMEFENTVEAPEFNEDGTLEAEVNQELESALDKIFGEGDFEERYPEEEDIKEEIRSDVEVTSEEIESEDDETIQEIKKHMKEAEKLPTLYIQRTLRSGQSIKSEGNIVIIGDVNPGAEVIAKGDITVWGVLGGIAQAGSDGNNYSRIRALKLNAIQLRIGEIFARRPDTVNVPYVQKTDSFIPEEARVIRKHIVIYKLHEAS